MNSTIVGRYLTPSGQVGVEITAFAGTPTYGYKGKWGAGCGGLESVKKSVSALLRQKKHMPELRWAALDGHQDEATPTEPSRPASASLPDTRVSDALRGACAGHLTAFCQGRQCDFAHAPTPVEIHVGWPVAHTLPQYGLTATVHATSANHARIAIVRDCGEGLMGYRVAYLDYIDWMCRHTGAEHLLHGICSETRFYGADLYDFDNHCVLVTAPYKRGDGYREVSLEIMAGDRDALAEWKDQIAAEANAPAVAMLEAFKNAAFYQRGHFTLSTQETMKALLVE